MKKIDPAVVAVIAIGVLFALLAFFPRSSQKDDTTCTDDNGCSIKVVFNDQQLFVLEGQVTMITMRLTAEQAASLGGDPYSQLRRVKSTLLTSSGNNPRKCSELEKTANSVLTLVVSDQTWQKTKGNKTPITLCENLVPTPTPAVTASVT